MAEGGGLRERLGAKKSAQEKATFSLTGEVYWGFRLALRRGEGVFMGGGRDLPIVMPSGLGKNHRYREIG